MFFIRKPIGFMQVFFTRNRTAGGAENDKDAEPIHIGKNYVCHYYRRPYIGDVCADLEHGSAEPRF
jgi:hypothetical protein